MASLLIPVGLWQNTAGLIADLYCYNNVTAACIDANCIYFGLWDGRILILCRNGDTLCVKMILMPSLASKHSPVMRLSLTTVSSDQSLSPQKALVSIHRNGVASLWSVDDGRCLLHNANCFSGTVLGGGAFMDDFVAIYGTSSTVNIIKCSTLEVVLAVQPATTLYPTFVMTKGPDNDLQKLADKPHGLNEIGLFIFTASVKDAYFITIDRKDLHSASGQAVTMIPIVFKIISEGAKLNYHLKTGLFCGNQMIVASNSMALRAMYETESSELHLFPVFTEMRPHYFLSRIYADPDDDRQVILITTDAQSLNEMFKLDLDSGETVPMGVVEGKDPEDGFIHLDTWPDGDLVQFEVNPQDGLSITSLLSPTTTSIKHYPSLPYSPHSIKGKEYVSSDAENGSPATFIHHWKGDFSFVGFADGCVQLMTVDDVLLSFNGIINDRVSFEKYHQHPISAMLLFDDDYLITGDISGMVCIYDIESRTKRMGIPGHSQPIVFLFKAFPGILGIVDAIGNCSLINMPEMTLHAYFNQHNQEAIKSIRLSTVDERRIALITTNGMVNVWNLDTRKREKTFEATAQLIDQHLSGTFTQTWEIPAEHLNRGHLWLRYSEMEPYSSTALQWRSSLVSDPLCWFTIDVRKWIANVKNVSSSTSVGDQQPCTTDSEEKSDGSAALVSSILSLLLPWGCDPDLDACARSLGLSRPRQEVALGVLGANGNVSFPLGASGTSSVTTSHQLLAISAVMEVLGDSSINIPRHEEWDRLRMLFVQKILTPEQQQPDHKTNAHSLPIPSLSVISKYWHDLSEELRRVSRQLVLQTIGRLDQDTLLHLIAYWRELLPTAAERRGHQGIALSSGRRMNRSAVILGIVGIHQPDLLTPDDRQIVAQSLMSLLLDERRNIFQSAAIELIGRAFTIWSPHIEGLSLFRMLFTWLCSMTVIDESGPTLQLVVPFDNASTLDTLESVRGTLIKLAIASADAVLPLWLSHDFAQSKSLIEKWTGVFILDNILRQSARTLSPYLVLVTEALYRLIESSGGLTPPPPSMALSTKNRVAGIALPLLMEMAQTYPSIALHRDTTKLAVANSSLMTPSSSIPTDTRIHLFDLRGSSGPRLLEGHVHAITCISFSPEGRLLVSYSWEEATLRWWQIPSGLIVGFLSGTVKPYKLQIVEPELTEAILTLRDRHPTAIDSVTIVWSASDVSPAELAINFLVGDQLVWSTPVPI